MTLPNEPLSLSILAIMYFGDVVFAVSGALTAARHRMDLLGFVMIGAITGIGGGTIRDLLIGREVWWIANPFELILVVTAAFLTFFVIKSDAARRKGMIWSDALGLAAFSVVGCNIALSFGAPFIIAVFMGMITATGGGVMRDVLTNTQPMILCGELYATAALVGALSYATLICLSVPGPIAEIAAFGTAFGLRAASVIFDIRMGPPGEFIRIGGFQGASGRSDH